MRAKTQKVGVGLTLGLALGLSVSLSAPVSAQDTPIPALDEAKKQIEANDAALFEAAFESCNPEALEDLLAENYRMLHDLGGLVASDRAAFLAGMTQQCAAREPGGANAGYKNRRQLVPGSRAITPLGQWGMLERGWHTFHEWRGDAIGWVQTGGARYIHVWRWMPEEAQFRLEESISVDHG